MKKLDIGTNRSKQVSFKTTPAIRKTLEEMAKYQGTTLSTLTEYIVRDWLKREVKEIN